MPELTIRQALVTLHILGYPASPHQARRNLSNWLAHGLVRGRKVEHQSPTGQVTENDPIWLVDEADLLEAWEEGRIPDRKSTRLNSSHTT